MDSKVSISVNVKNSVNTDIKLKGSKVDSTTSINNLIFQADWEEENPSSLSYIKHKPNIAEALRDIEDRIYSLKEYVEGNVVKFNSVYDFPNIGTSGRIYLDVNNGASYIWDETHNHYLCVGRDYANIEVLSGGNA